MQKKCIHYTIPAINRVTGILILLFFIALVCGCIQDLGNTGTIQTSTPENKIVFNDTYGNRIELPHPAERIIVNYESISEMLITIGAADHIVGVGHATKTYRRDITEKLRPDVTEISNSLNSNIEIIAQMHPEDLVIIIGNSNLIQNLDQLKTLNPYSIVFFECYTPEQMYDEAYALGEMTGHREGAQRYIEFNQKYQKLIESRLTDIPDDEMPAIYIAYGTPTTDYVVGGTSPSRYVFNTLHVRNVNKELNVSNPIINREWVFQKDPDIIFYMGHYGSNDGYNSRGESIVSVHDDFINRSGYEKLKAVRSDKVYFINRGLFLNPRAVIGLVYLAKAIYPDRFADIDPDAVRREYAQEFGFGGEKDVEWFYPSFEPVNATAVKSTDKTSAR